MKEILETLKNADNEATRAPYWLILDPDQNMSCDVYNLSSQITGLFFSREDAQEYLETKSYHFTKRAVVFCLSGHHSYKYEKLCKEIGL